MREFKPVIIPMFTDTELEAAELTLERYPMDAQYISPEDIPANVSYDRDGREVSFAVAFLSAKARDYFYETEERLGE